MEEVRSRYLKILTRTNTEKRPMKRHWRRRKDNNTMEFKEIGVDIWNLVDSAQDRYYCRASGFLKPGVSIPREEIKKTFIKETVSS